MTTIDEKARDADLRVVLDGLERSTELSQAELMEWFDTLDKDTMRGMWYAVDNLENALLADKIKRDDTSICIDEDMENWDYGDYSVLADEIRDDMWEKWWRNSSDHVVIELLDGINKERERKNNE